MKESEKEELKLIMGAKDIADEVGLPVRRIYALVDRGEIPVIKIGASIGIRRAALRKWIMDMEKEAETAYFFNKQSKGMANT